MSLYLDEATRQRLAAARPEPTPQPVPQGFSSSQDEYQAGQQALAQARAGTFTPPPEPAPWQGGGAGEVTRRGFQTLGEFATAPGSQALVGLGMSPESVNALPWYIKSPTDFALNPLNLAGVFTGGLSALPGALVQGAGAGLAAGGVQQVDQGLPNYVRYPLEFGAGFLGGAASGMAFNRLARNVPNIVGGDAQAIQQAAPDANQIGRVEGTDSLFTAGPQGERIGPTGNISQMRLGREPVRFAPQNDRLYATNYGRAQQAQLADEEAQAFRSAYEKTIAGAKPPEDALPLGGGAGMTDAEFARLAAKKAAGGTLSPEEQARLMNTLGERMGALKPEDIPAAKEAFYRAPENLGGPAVPPELQANIESTVKRADQRNTITNALANARSGEQIVSRETSPLESVIARNAEELPTPIRTVPKNLAEMQAKARARAQQPPTAGGASQGRQPPLAPTLPGMPEPTPAQVTFGDRVRDAMGVPMSAKSTYDLSAPGRQLAPMLYAHPTAIPQVLNAQTNALLSRDAFEASQRALVSDPNAVYRDIAGVELGGITKGLVREEQISSNLAQKALPGSVRFNDAYTAAINEGRNWLFNSMLKEVDPSLLTESGLKNGGTEQLQRIGRIVNASTGRGDLAKALTDNKVFGQPLLWAPKLLAGRVQLVSSVFAKDPLVRNEAARQLASFVGVNAAILGMIKATGAGDVELDPRSSDWGTIRIGNRRYDPWAGYKPIVNLIARSGVTAKNTLAEYLPEGTLATDTPNVKQINTPDGPGLLYTKSGLKIIGDFLRAKLAPVPGEVANQLTGRDVTGQSVDKPMIGPEGKLGGRVEHATIGLLAPIFAESLAQELGYTIPQGYQQGGMQQAGIEGAKSLLGNVPYFFGTGGGYYQPNEPATPTRKGLFLPQPPRLPQAPKPPRIPQIGVPR